MHFDSDSILNQIFSIIRKEHMKMQIKLEGKIKEKLFYYPTTFDKLDEIVRYGLSKQTGEDGIKLYPSSSDANKETAG